MELSIPNSSRKTSTKSKPWFSQQCSQAVREENSAYQAWKSQPNSCNLSAFRQARNACKTQIENSKNSHVQSIARELTSCPSGSRPFWSLAKAIRQNFSTSAFPPLSKPDGSLATSPEEKANALAEAFAENANLDAGDQVPSLPSSLPASMSPISFRQPLIRKILSSLDISKAPGADGIPAIVLKNCAPELTPILCKLFSLSYDSGVIPVCWKLALVQPIPKKGDKSLPSTPITGQFHSSPSCLR